MKSLQYLLSHPFKVGTWPQVVCYCFTVEYLSWKQLNHSQSPAQENIIDLWTMHTLECCVHASSWKREEMLQLNVQTANVSWLCDGLHISKRRPADERTHTTMTVYPTPARCCYEKCKMGQHSRQSSSEQPGPSCCDGPVNASKQCSLSGIAVQGTEKFRQPWILTQEEHWLRSYASRDWGCKSWSYGLNS